MSGTTSSPTPSSPTPMAPTTDLPTTSYQETFHTNTMTKTTRRHACIGDITYVQWSRRQREVGEEGVEGWWGGEMWQQWQRAGGKRQEGRTWGVHRRLTAHYITHLCWVSKDCHGRHWHGSLPYKDCRAELSDGEEGRGLKHGLRYWIDTANSRYRSIRSTF